MFIRALSVVALVAGVAVAQEPAAPPEPAKIVVPAEAMPPAAKPVEANGGDAEKAAENAKVNAHTAEGEHVEHKAEGEHTHHEEEAAITNWWSWDYGPGAKEAEHKHYPPPFGFALINFAIFLVIMGRLLFRPLGNMARDRHTRIRTDLDAASKLRAEAEAKLKEFEARTANVDQEVQSIVAQIEKEAAAEKVRIIAAAEAEAVRLKADAEKQITTELARIKAEIRAEVVDRVVAAAEEILKKQLTADDQGKLVQSYVVKLEEASSGAKS